MLDTTVPWVTDGGLETVLLFHEGLDLPEFAAFPLVEQESGREVLRTYYRAFAAVAHRHGAGLLLETPTWRANPDWAARLGYDAPRLAAVQHAAVDLLRGLAGEADEVRLSGVVGPRGDGYAAGVDDVDEAADYHRPQVEALADAGVDVVHAMTLGSATEGRGVVRAARGAGVAVGVSFTVEVDGRLADGTTLRDAVEQGDADWYGVNCAHPSHLLHGLDGGSWQRRLVALRPNASVLSHEELDAADTLDEGDLEVLLPAAVRVAGSLPGLAVLGGCCGTDVRHVRALWSVLGDRLTTSSR